MWSDLRLEREFVNVQLFCRAVGQPKPEVKWFNENNEEIKDGSEYEVIMIR